MRDEDVQRLIGMLENALRVHPDKGYQIGTVEESEKFRKSREGLLEKNFEDPLVAPENKKL